MNIAEYYKNSIIRKRIKEFSKGAEYLVGYGVYLKNKSGVPFRSFEKNELDVILSKGLDIYRSTWDEEATLGILDVEYFNLDFPGEVYLNPKRVFGLMEPVYEEILSEFKKYKINPLVTMTGQGYHFVFKIKRFSVTDKKLESIGYVHSTLKEKYKVIKGRRKRPVSIRHGKAYDGMGRALEYFVDRVIKNLKKRNYKLPLQITDVAVGRGEVGREAISIDLSMYGDPIYMRDIRCPYSSHQKHKIDVWKVGQHIAMNVPARIALPRKNISLDKMLKAREDYNKAVKYAFFYKTDIPDATKEFARLIDDYRNSSLYRFHREFDKVNFDERNIWDRTYNAFDVSILPMCLQYTINFPNPNLLKPTNIQTLVRVFLKLNWHPKHIAGFITSKYEEKKFNWNENWDKYDGATRAIFYVRIFSSLIHEELDKEMDLNCISQQEKGYCVKPWCGWNLSQYKIS